MCGIAGRILNSPGYVGQDLVNLMDAQSHRGADSTGFAIYTVPTSVIKVLTRKYLPMLISTIAFAWKSLIRTTWLAGLQTNTVFVI